MNTCVERLQDSSMKDGDSTRWAGFPGEWTSIAAAIAESYCTSYPAALWRTYG